MTEQEARAMTRHGGPLYHQKLRKEIEAIANLTDHEIKTIATLADAQFEQLFGKEP